MQQNSRNRNSNSKVVVGNVPAGHTGGWAVCCS
jgi:hypothetical protein